MTLTACIPIVPHHAGNDIAVRVHGGTEAGPGKDAIDHGLNLQVGLSEGMVCAFL